MSRRIALRLALTVLVAALVFPLLGFAQSQGTQTQDSQNQSVADAARRAREQKKAAAKQPAPVITDDTLKRSAPAAQPADEPSPAPTSEVAPAAATVPAAQPPADSSSAPAATAAPVEQPAPTAEAEKKANDSAELAALKQQLAEEQKGLELLQRELSLQQDTYISNPDHSHDIAGKTKLDAMLQQITGKQQDLDALKAQLAALQSSASSAPPTPPNPPQF